MEQFFISIMMSLIMFILSVVGSWVIYAKAKRGGWEALIPVHSFVTLLEIAGKPGGWIFLFFIPIVNVVLYIMTIHGLSKRFGHSVWFTLGLLFLPFIFNLILAFGGSKYIEDYEEPEPSKGDAEAGKPAPQINNVVESEPTISIPVPVQEPQPSLVKEEYMNQNDDAPKIVMQEPIAPVVEQPVVEVVQQPEPQPTPQPEPMPQPVPQPVAQPVPQPQSAPQPQPTSQVATPTEKKVIPMKTLIIIVAAVTLLVGIGVGVFIYMSRDKSDVAKEVYEQTEGFADETTSGETSEEVKQPAKPAVSKPEPVQEPNTLQLSYGRYSGDIENGKASGMGKMVYTKRTLISKYDRKKRYAEVGQYVIGNWYNNELDFGKLYNKNGDIIETIIIGRAE